jgi:GTP cyclohydrolase I
MKDIQSQLDHRRVNIKKVGVKTISYPITLLDKENNRQSTVASVNMYVNLPHKFKGTHMSRFIEILNRFHGEIDLNSFQTILEEMKQRLEAEASHVEISFPYFLRKEQKTESLKSCRYECQMHGSLRKSSTLEFRLVVPIFLPLKKRKLKGMPRSLGHWGNSTISIQFKRFLWIEDIITLVEKAIFGAQHQENMGVDDVYSVESLTEQISEKLAAQTEIKWYSVTVINFGEGYSTFASLQS